MGLRARGFGLSHTARTRPLGPGEGLACSAWRAVRRSPHAPWGGACQVAAASALGANAAASGTPRRAAGRTSIGSRHSLDPKLRSHTCPYSADQVRRQQRTGRPHSRSQRARPDQAGGQTPQQTGAERHARDRVKPSAMLGAGLSRTCRPASPRPAATLHHGRGEGRSFGQR